MEKIKEDKNLEEKDYVVEITEELQGRVHVSATSEEEAIELVKEMYNEGVIILDSYHNCIDYRFKVSFRE